MVPAKVSLLVKKSSLVFDKLSNLLLTPYGLTGSQFKILMVLYTSPVSSVRQADLEAKFSMTNPTVTGLINKLEEKGLVQRLPHPQDRRSKLLVLTDRALDMKGELMALADSLEEQMTARLTPEECDQLTTLLTKMLDFYEGGTTL